MSTSVDYVFDDVTKDAGDTLPVKLEFAESEGVAIFWARNEKVDALEYARPSTPTGYAYQVSTPGRTGAQEPVWPTTLLETVQDGSAVWTCVASDLNGFNTISAPSAVSDPVGLTIGSVAVEEGVNIVADYTGGDYGDDFDVVYSFTIAGRARKARQRVLIRKK